LSNRRCAGIILSSNEGTFNTIQIDFTDTGMGRQQRFVSSCNVNRNIICCNSFTDHYGFTLGAMSLSGAVFATATQDDTNSQVPFFANPRNMLTVVMYSFQAALCTFGLSCQYLRMQSGRSILRKEKKRLLSPQAKVG
jgi:hypothetical protein